MTLPARIAIRDVRALGVHGVLAHERERPQPFSVDVDAHFDAGPAAASDALADTIDYGALTALVADAVATTSFLLLEALAGELARRLLAADPRIERVSVTVRKLRPPVAADVGSIGVEVTDVRRP